MSEHAEQCALILLCQYKYSEYPELALLFAIPNGGLRSKAVAAKLKREGVQAGVPDLFLPVARSPFHGLFIEMKFGANTSSPKQKLWQSGLRAQGYAVVECWGSEAAYGALITYLEGGHVA